MDKRTLDKLAIWLRRKHPGTVVKLRDFWIQYVLPVFGIVPISATLHVKVIRKDGRVEDLGIVSTHAVTDAFVAALVDTLKSSVASFSLFKYHDTGEGVGAEDATDTALGSPCGEARDTGTQIEGATANIYKTVATHTYAGPFTITEHGVFNDPTAGALMDRSVFTGIVVASGDKIETTYQLTCTAGG